MHLPGLYLIFFFISFIYPVDMKVNWIISTDHVIIGGNLRLFCNTSGSSCSNCSNRWLKEDNLLSFHDTVTDANKYAVEQQKDGFTLLIKNATLNDFDAEYECSYSRERFKKKLILPASYEFKYLEAAKRNLSVTHRTLLLAVDFREVHPIPNCKIYLDGEDLSSNVAEKVEKRGYMYQVIFRLNHTVKPGRCEGKILVYCITGTRRDTIINEHVSFESCSYIGGSDEWIENVVIISAVIGIVVTIMAGFCFKCYTKLKRSMSKRKSNSRCEEYDLESGETMLKNKL